MPPPAVRLRPLDPRLLAAAPALRRQVAVLVVLLTLRALCTVAAAALLADALVLLWQDGSAGIGRQLALLAAAVAGRSAADALVELTGGRAAERVRGQLRAGLLAGIGRAGPGGPVGVDPARTAHTAGPALDALDGYVCRAVPALVAAVVVPPVVLVRIGLADRLSLVLVLLTLPLVPLFLALIGLTTRERTQRAYATLALLAARLLDLLQGLPTLKVHGRAAGQVAAVGRITERYRRETLRALRWAFLSGLALDLLATLSVALVAVSIGLRLQSGGLALRAGLTVLLLAPEVFAPLRAVGAQYHASAAALEAAAAALELADLAAGQPRGVLLASEPLVSLLDVTVHHPGRPVAALEGISVSLAPGEVVAVEGPSGAGKSTLLAVLLGAVQPDSGTVVTAQAGGAWRDRVAWTPQRPRTSRDTAGEEARLGDLDATDEQVCRALADCSAPAAPTPLGEAGRAVSAGQRRRVALARALLRARAVAARGEPALVLLDEPSEDLDQTGEQVVARMVDSLRGVAAVVLVTHSPSLAAVADRRLRLVAGRIVDDVRGAPDLSAAGGPSPRSVQAPVDVPAAPAAGQVPAVQAAVQVPAVQAAVQVPTVPAAGQVPGAVLRAFLVDGRGLGARTAAALLLSCGSALAALALTACSAWLVLRAAQQPELQTLALAVVGVRTFALAKALLRYAERLAAHDVALRLVARTRMRVVAALVPLAPGGLDLWRRGDVLRRFTADVDAVQDALVRGGLPIAGAAASGAAGLALTRAVAPSATVPLLAGLVATGAVAALGTLLGRSGAGRAARLAGQRDEAAVGFVEALPELWAYGAERTRAAEVLLLDEQVDRAARPARWASAAAVLGAALAAGLVPVAVLAAAAGHVSGLAAGVVALAAATAVEPVAGLAPAWAAMATAGQRAARVAGLLAAPVPVPEPPVPATAPGHPVGLVVAGADLGYGSPLLAAQPVLRGLGLQLPAGARLAIAGPSGCGKSTLVAALLRLLQPSAGAVDIEGDGMRVALADLPAQAVPRLVSGCLQDDHLFAATLRENLRIGRPDATDADLDDVARRLGLLPWVRGLPDGWSTQVGADGAWLSGGQRQRVLLARALLAAPSVLVLDEPTAHLDPDTEALVVADLLRATHGHTVLLSTHRTSGLDELDGVVRLEHREPAALL